MANPPPNDLNTNLPEDEHVQPEHAPAMLGFTPTMLNIPNNNNNGWIEEDDKEEMEAEEEIEAEDNVDDDDEVINPHEEFGGNFLVGESSSTRALLTHNGRVHAHGPMGCNLETVYKKVRNLDRQMYDRYNTERMMAKKFKEDDLCMNHHKYDISALDTTMREQSSDHSKMMQLVESLSRQFDEFQNDRATRHSESMSRWEAKVWEHLPLRLRFQGAPSEPPTNPAFVPRSDDPYVIVRDAATFAARDDGDDLALTSRALTWWNLQVATLGLEVANGTSWTDMKTMMTKEFGPPKEIQRIESKLWNIKKRRRPGRIQGLFDSIKGEVTSSSTTTLNAAVHMAHSLMEQKRLAKAERDAEGKKRKAMTTTHNEQAYQRGTTPKCNRRGLCHFDNCPPKCTNYVKIGHKARNCKCKTMATGANAQPVVHCYECEEKGHKSNTYPKRNNYQGGNATSRAYATREGQIRVLLHLIDIKPVRQNISYDIELADGRIVSTNTVLKGCILNLVDHLFDIDLMPIKLGTFDIIVEMNWLVERNAIIVYGKKEVHVPYKNKTLVVKGDSGASRLKVISCIKARKCIERGCQLFVAHVIKKELTKKCLEDVPVICNFPEVFPDDLPRIPPPRQVEFKIDLVPEATPVSRAPYRLAPSKMKDLSDQLQQLLEKGFIHPSSSPWGASVIFVKKKDGVITRVLRRNDFEERGTKSAKCLNSFPIKGRLIRLVLASMHVFWASVFILLTGVMLDLEQLMRGFLWIQGESKKGRAKVAWDVVCLSKFEGGLGIRRLEIFYRALISSHIWSLLSFKESLWVKWIHSYKLNGRSFWDIPCFNLSFKVNELIVNNSWSWPIVWLVKYHSLNSIVVSPLSTSCDRMVWVDLSNNEVGFSVSNVWECIRLRSDSIGCIPSDLNAIINFISPLAKLRFVKSVISKLVFAAAYYFIWQERNNWLFRKKKRSYIQELVQIVCFESLCKLKWYFPIGVLVCVLYWSWLSSSSSSSRLFRLFDLRLRSRLGVVDGLDGTKRGYQGQCLTVQSSQQWLLFSSSSGNVLHWQWELLLAVGTL
uniref:Reverse transcriptase domain-containing protein n=1 Tax=Tanacetum cinerariifolium TaxID=118510 RepID=A0A6L2L8H4_TANCI|nr:hypothetical protein [Tanacetum cinerariifolium]